MSGIQVRIVAGDVDQADAAALAIGRVLTVMRESPARPRRSGDGVTVYLDVELPPVDVDAADRADPGNRCGRAGCGQYVPLDDALPVPTVDDGGVRYARWHPACLRAEQRERRIR
jgi:hypothetical protein